MRKRLIFYKKWLVEITETLCTICLCLARINRTNHYGADYNEYLQSHFTELKKFSTQARREINK